MCLKFMNLYGYGNGWLSIASIDLINLSFNFGTMIKALLGMEWNKNAKIDVQHSLVDSHFRWRILNSTGVFDLRSYDFNFLFDLFDSIEQRTFF